MPWYLNDYIGSDLKTELFGKTYDAPFGVAPIGLQGLMWPKATEILARAATNTTSPSSSAPLARPVSKPLPNLRTAMPGSNFTTPPMTNYATSLSTGWPPPDCQLWSSWPIPRLLAGDRRRSATAFPSPQNDPP